MLRAGNVRFVCYRKRLGKREGDLREIYSGEVLVNNFKHSSKAKLLIFYGRHDGI